VKENAKRRRLENEQQRVRNLSSGSDTQIDNDDDEDGNRVRNDFIIFFTIFELIR
jgi:hypothetical protein